MTVRIVDDRVPLTPERVPRLEVAFVACADELGVAGIDARRAVAGKRERAGGPPDGGDQSGLNERIVSMVSNANLSPPGNDAST